MAFSTRRTSGIIAWASRGVNLAGVLAIVAIFPGGCATSSTRAAVHVMHESKVPVQISTGRGRVAIRVDRADTILEIHGATLRFLGHSGYQCSLTVRSGWVKVGAVELDYNDQRLRFKKPKIALLTVAEGGSYLVYQDGSAGRDPMAGGR